MPKYILIHITRRYVPESKIFFIKLKKNTVITLETLVKEGIVKSEEVKKFGVKILGGGKLKRKKIIRNKLFLKEKHETA